MYLPLTAPEYEQMATTPLRKTISLYYEKSKWSVSNNNDNDIDDDNDNHDDNNLNSIANVQKLKLLHWNYKYWFYI